MPTYYSPLSALHSGSAAGSLGRTPGAPDSSSPITMTIPLATDPLSVDLIGRWTTAPGMGPVQPLLTPDVVVIGVELVVNAAGAGEPLILRAKCGETSWTTTTAAGATTRLDNGGRLCIEQRSAQAVGLLFTWTPVPAVTFSGATLAAWAVEPISASVTFVLASRHRAAFGAAMWGGFRDEPADLTSRLLLENSLRSLSTRGGALFPVQGNVGAIGAPPFPPLDSSQDSVMVDCMYAGPSPYAATWCDASDIGPSSTERVRLPVDLASNNAASYQRYPASFFRRPTFVRGVELAAEDPTATGGAATNSSITTADGALCLYTTTVDVVASTWLLQIDGVAWRTTILHDTYTGLRRPADIWNRVIVGAIARNGPLELRGSDPATSFPLLGFLQRLEFLEYATFLAGYQVVEGSYLNAYVPAAQIGADIPGP
jgi:hypothetical protein